MAQKTKKQKRAPKSKFKTVALAEPVAEVSAKRADISVKGFTANEQKVIYQMASAIAVRASIAARLGKTYSDDRDIYTALGYPKSPTFNDYMARYHRQDIARAIIDAPVRACWRRRPRITEDQDKPTPLEQAWESLVKKTRLYHRLSRADRLASIGTFAVVVLGFDDTRGIGSQITQARSLLYLTPYSQANVSISTYDMDKKSPRYGLPQKYSVTMKASGGVGSHSAMVDQSRIIHIAEDLLEDNIEGVPRLRSVLNRLIDLERVAGGSSEMFWRGGLPGYGFKLDPEATIADQDLDALQDEIEEYMHGLKRYIRLRGMSVEDMAVQVADPSNHVAILIDLIACAVRIPKRILLGSERGELASSQDERAWNERIGERQKEHCEAIILQPLIDKLIEVKVLPPPSVNGYKISWPELGAPSEKEKADVSQSRSVALKNYVESLGADQIVPPEIFLRKILGFDEETIEEIQSIVKQMQIEDETGGEE